VSDFPSFSLLVMTPSAANADGPYHLFLRRDSIILMLRVRQKSVAGHEYARLNIGASITRENSENGALPIREGEQARKQRKQKPPRGETWRLFHELINSTRPRASFYNASVTDTAGRSSPRRFQERSHNRPPLVLTPKRSCN
jgi:hypothetical protein